MRVGVLERASEFIKLFNNTYWYMNDVYIRLFILVMSTYFLSFFHTACIPTFSELSDGRV